MIINVSKLTFTSLLIALLTTVSLAGQLTITQQPWGQLEDGQQVVIYTLTNANGVKARITNFGAHLVSMEVPDRDGKIQDVTLGFDDVEGYVNCDSYLGATVGRYGNRIAKGQFALYGTKYTLAANNGVNHLHGGIKGFNKVLWASKSFLKSDSVGVVLTCLSPDMEEGYPGDLTSVVTYSLDNDNALKIEYEAYTDKPTPINLTHHSYFNLTGDARNTILDHELMLAADHYTPVDETLIPTGEIPVVEGTPMDFRAPEKIGARINDDFQQLKFGLGYDHNWVLRNQSGSLMLAATVYDPQSGRLMEIMTTEPGIQFYAGNFLDGSIIGKNNQPYNYRCGFCLETQHYPDSPNRKDFPSVILHPAQKYTHTCIYRFSVK